MDYFGFVYTGEAERRASGWRGKMAMGLK